MNDQASQRCERHCALPRDVGGPCVRVAVCGLSVRVVLAAEVTAVGTLLVAILTLGNIRFAPKAPGDEGSEGGGKGGGSRPDLA